MTEDQNSTTSQSASNESTEPKTGDETASTEETVTNYVTDIDGVVIAPGSDEGAPGLRRKVIDALRTCFDPEIPVNIYDLGMIYRIDIKPDNHVEFVMTLTSPACPVAGSLPPDAERKVAAAEGVTSAKHELVWEPAWNPDLMHECAKLELGWYEDM